MDQRRIFFSNLRLLGCDMRAYEAKYNIPFNKDMFHLPNKRGAEVVLYFLFHRLNPAICREEFRDCWPVLEKKQEAHFRKTCSNWLSNISKEEPDAHLPRIAASLFLAPGGEKFYQLLFHLSTYVLQRALERECGPKVKDLLRYPILTQQNLHFAECIAHTLPCGIIRKRKKYLNTLQQTVILNKEWKDYASELVKNHRKRSKDIRELEYRIRTEQQKASESGLARGSPMAKRTHSVTNVSFGMDPPTIKRVQRVQKVQDMWKQIDNFCDTEAAEREVIESIVEQTIKKHKIDATEINIKIPDLLLRECEDEIRRRHVDNTFHGGKLNLISVVQLWNLCLHLYIEKLQQVGVPKFETDVGIVTTQVHTHHAYLANVQSLRKQVKELLPVLKRSVESLQSKMDYESCKQSTPKSIHSMSVGVGFTEPTPPISFSPQIQPSGYTPVGPMANIDVVEVTTPEASVRLAQGITDTVRKHSSVLFQGTPIHTTHSELDRIPLSRLPKPVGIIFSMDAENEKQKIDGSTIQRNENNNNLGIKSTERISKATVLNSSHSSHSSKSNTSNRSQSSGNSLLNQPPIQNGYFQQLTPTVESAKFGTEARHTSDRQKGKRSLSDIIVDQVMNGSFQKSDNQIFSPQRDEVFQHLKHHTLNESTSSLTDLIVDQVLKESGDDKAEYTDAGFVTRDLLSRSPLNDSIKTPTHDPMLHQSHNRAEASSTSIKCENAVNKASLQTSLDFSQPNIEENGSQTINDFGLNFQPHQKFDSSRSDVSEDREIYDYEEPFAKKEHIYDYEIPIAKVNQNTNSAMRKMRENLMSPQARLSPARVGSLDASLESPPSLGSYRSSLLATPPGSQRGSLRNSPRHTPRSASGYLPGQQNKTPTQRTPIEQEVRRMWHEALNEKDDIHTQSLPAQYSVEDFTGLMLSPKSDVGPRIVPGCDLPAVSRNEEQLAFTPHRIGESHSESQDQFMFSMRGVSDIPSTANVSVPELIDTSFHFEENLDDIEMPDLRLHESLEDFFSPPNKSTDDKMGDSFALHSSSFNQVKFPVSIENDIFSSHPENVDCEILNGHENLTMKNNTKIQQSTMPTEQENEDNAPQRQMSDAEKRYWILKQQLQKELKRPEDFTSLAKPLNFKLEDFDFLNSDGIVKGTGNITETDTNNIANSEKQVPLLPDTDHVFSVLEEQENINVEELDVDLLASFDDSFAPLKTGLCLEGGTPVKTPIHSVGTKSLIEEDDEDDLMARFQKLKVAASAFLQK